MRTNPSVGDAKLGMALLGTQAGPPVVTDRTGIVSTGAGLPPPWFRTGRCFPPSRSACTPLTIRAVLDHMLQLHVEVQETGQVTQAANARKLDLSHVSDLVQNPATPDNDALT